jgi:predicted nucleic acid-binding protein
VSRHILLDSSPLGLLSKPTRGTAVHPIVEWTRACLAAGHDIYIPEVIDYELRRELLRAQKTTSVKELDSLRAAFEFLPINSAAMLLAADLWARSRAGGQPTGDPLKLDIDVILAAQALTLMVPAGGDVIIATDNVGHLSRFAAADRWSNIHP